MAVTEASGEQVVREFVRHRLGPPNEPGGGATDPAFFTELVRGGAAAGDELDGETLKRMFRAQARAVEKIEKDPRPYVHYFVRETGGLLKAEEFQTWRLLHAAPQPYTRERFDDTYNWTVKWNMTVPGATYENTVDNRAWQ